MELSEIISQSGITFSYLGIERIPLTPYSMRKALQIFDALGKQRKSGFVIDSENRFLYENLLRWAHSDGEMQCLHPRTKQIIKADTTKGIFIAGGTGTGKTWALELLSSYCALHNIRVKKGEKIYMLSFPSVRADKICMDYMNQGSFDSFINSPILCVQDMGDEPKESQYMGNREEVIKRLLSIRGDRRDRITLISSNIPLNHKLMTDTYGDRVVSRLEEMCNYFELVGKDRRRM